MPVRLVLLSSSQVYGHPPYLYARDALDDLFSGCRDILFAPFALADYDGYTARATELLAPFGRRVVGLHTLDARKAVEDAELLFVGGGNTFRLLTALHRLQLIEPVHRRVLGGELRYLGSSAGSNVACPSLRTTNDMPIVEPPSFGAFDLVPFQLNPHYLDPPPDSTHMGETRQQRIEQFLEANDVVVVGLREGAWLQRVGAQLTLGGIAGARVFRRGHEPAELAPGTDVSWLLELQPRFDVGL